MSFDAIIRAVWSPAECAALRQEADYWESYDELPSHLGFTPGGYFAEMDAAITYDLYERIREAKDGYRAWVEDDALRYGGEDGTIEFFTVGEPSYGKTYMVEGSIGPVEMGLDDYETFLYGENRTDDWANWAEDFDWEDEG